MPKNKSIEKEKLFAKRLNQGLTTGEFISTIGAYLTADQIIPGII